MKVPPCNGVGNNKKRGTMSEEKLGYFDAGPERETASAIVSDGTVKIKLLNVSSLVNYLLDHELDIAWNEDDYGDLLGVFTDIIGYPPNGKESCVI